MSAADSALRVAEDVADVLRQQGVQPLVIGAIALAAHHYVRSTEDIDLGVNADLATMRRVASLLRAKGFDVELREPDAADPLNGVIDVSGSFGLIQVISFADRFPAVIEDALQSSQLVVRDGSSLAIVPVPHLVALKLYAGGFKAKADVVELLRRNPELDVGEVRKLCRRFRLRGLEALIREAGIETDRP